MSNDEFYEDDEPIEDVRAAWNAGDKGTTSGPRDLSQAEGIIRRAVCKLEGRQGAPLQIVGSGTNATTFRGWVSA